MLGGVQIVVDVVVVVGLLLDVMRIVDTPFGSRLLVRFKTAG